MVARGLVDPGEARAQFEAIDPASFRDAVEEALQAPPYRRGPSRRGPSDPQRRLASFGVRLLIDAAEEILVISPTLPGRLDWLASATDKTKEQADERVHERVRVPITVFDTPPA